MVGLLFALLPGNVTRLTPRHRLGLAGVTTSIIGFYVALRILIFGSGYAAYSQDGYMFLGLLHYEDSNDLPQLLRYLNYVENIVKHAFAPVLPVFDDTGALLSGQALSISLPIIVSTAVLCGLAVTRYVSRLQWLALTIILANAVTHYLLFRHRLHYLSHAAFCLFVAGSPLLAHSSRHTHRTLAVKTLAVITLVGSILWTTNMLNRQMGIRMSELRALPTDGIKRYGPVVEQVLLRYR
jgi:hypothetical protein